MTFIKRIRVKRRDTIIDLSRTNDGVVESDYIYVRKRRKLTIITKPGTINIIRAKFLKLDGLIQNKSYDPS